MRILQNDIKKIGFNTLDSFLNHMNISYNTIYTKIMRGLPLIGEVSDNKILKADFKVKGIEIMSPHDIDYMTYEQMGRSGDTTNYKKVVGIKNSVLDNGLAFHKVCIIVCKKDDEYFLVDGRHRLEAFRESIDEIPVIVIELINDSESIEVLKMFATITCNQDDVSVFVEESKNGNIDLPMAKSFLLRVITIERKQQITRETIKDALSDIRFSVMSETQKKKLEESCILTHCDGESQNYKETVNTKNNSKILIDNIIKRDFPSTQNVIIQTISEANDRTTMDNAFKSYEHFLATGEKSVLVLTFPSVLNCYDNKGQYNPEEVVRNEVIKLKRVIDKMTDFGVNPRYKDMFIETLSVAPLTLGYYINPNKNDYTCKKVS